MKIKINTENIQEKIRCNQAIVSEKSILPILSNILLETTNDNKLKMVTTNLDIGIITEVDVEVVQPGIITIPAKRS